MTGAPAEYLSSLGQERVCLGLHRIERTLLDLGRPDQQLRTVLVAGTNGKGSTCAMVARALLTAGYRIGLYTSPHLHRFNERMQIDGAPVRGAGLAELIGAVRHPCPRHDEPDNEDGLTYFAFATVLALLWFARHEVEVAVVETGLGGHLDARTPRPYSILMSFVIAMTSIGLDDREYLGASLTEVARAEASIFQPGVPAVVAPGQAPDLLSVLQAGAEQRHTSLSVCSSEYGGPLSLRGRHQQLNAALAKGVLESLAPYRLMVAEDIVAAGLASTRWPDRLEEIDGVVPDVAHNADGARALARVATIEVRPIVPLKYAPVALVCAGTADLPVAEECAETLRAFGLPFERLYDVGVAGMHRLLARREVLDRASVAIVVAGMEGALPSVLGGLVSIPVIAVPTSVGYGAGVGGLAALAGMLTSCAAGVTVCNIDNGFGAAFAALRILQSAPRFVLEAEGTS